METHDPHDPIPKYGGREPFTPTIDASVDLHPYRQTHVDIIDGQLYTNTSSSMAESLEVTSIAARYFFRGNNYYACNVLVARICLRYGHHGNHKYSALSYAFGIQ